jgi:hypothetical protein
MMPTPRPPYTIEELRALRASIAALRARTIGPWHCPACANIFNVRPARGRCSECDTRVVAEHQRERDADDGVQYADPRDEREDRRHER